MTKRQWFLNRFDIVLNGLCLPIALVILGILALQRDPNLCKEGEEMITPWIGYLVVVFSILINIGMGCLVAKKDWGWKWLPVVLIIRLVMVAFFVLALLAGSAAIGSKMAAKDAREGLANSIEKLDAGGVIRNAKDINLHLKGASWLSWLWILLWGWFCMHAFSAKDAEEE